MKHFTSEDISSWDRFYRTHFINSLSGFKSVHLVGTVNKKGIPNLAIFSNIVHIGAEPALIGFINRPKEAAPHTIKNIEETGVYTMNHIIPSMIEQAHQTSAKYNEDDNEFEKVGLGIEWKNHISAPFVEESHIKYAMKLVEILPIKHNNTFLVIGSVTDVFISESVIEKDGFLRIDNSGSICSLGVDAYYETNFLTRIPYAKPDQWNRKHK